MNKILKKVLSIVLSIAMIATSVTISNTNVKAADESVGTTTVASYDELITALQKGEAVTLSNNIVAEGVIDATDANINLNEYTLTLADDCNNNFLGDSTIKNGTLSIDGVEVGGDCIIGIGDRSNDATLNLVDVNIIGSDYSFAFAMLMIYGDGTLNIEGGVWTLSNEKGEAGGVIKNQNGSGTDGNINITGTKMVMDDISRGITGGTVVLDNVDMTITGGDNGINGSALTVKNSVLNISDGTGRALTVTDSNVNIESSNLNFSNMGEAGIRFKTANTLTFDETSSLSECSIYADVPGAKVNDINITDTEEAKGSVSVVNGSVTMKAIGTITTAYISNTDGTTKKFGTLADAIAEANDGDTVTLLKSATGEGLKINKSITIDLGGYTYTLNTSVGSSGTQTLGLQILEKSKDVTIKNGTINMVEDVAGDNYTFFKLIMNYANLTLEDVTLDCANGVAYNGTTDVGFAAIECDAGQVNLIGDTSIINSELSKESWTIISYDNPGYNGTSAVNINTTGTIEGVLATWNNGSVLNIENGTFTIDEELYGTTYSQLYKVSDGTIAVSGGTFEQEIPEAYCAEGFVPTKNEDGTYGVKEDTSLTGSGTAEDPFIIDSLEKLEFFRDNVNSENTYSGQYVKLTTDIDLNNEDWTPIGYMGATFKGTFDGGYNTISNLKITKTTDNTAENNSIGLFGRTDSPAVIQNLTIENVDITGSLYVGAVVGRGYTGKAIENVTVKGNITIDAWWYAGVIGGNGYMNLVNNCHVIGNDSSYIKGNDGSYIGGIWGFRGEGGQKITNCTVTNLDISGVDRVGGITGIAHYGNTIADCKVSGVSIEATDADATTVGLIAGACQGTTTSEATFTNNTVENAVATVGNEEITSIYGSNINGGVGITNYVASVDGVVYETLQVAIDAADAGETVTLINNVTENIVIASDDNITLDLNGFTLSNNGRANTITNKGALTITGNGTVDNTAGGNVGAAMRNEVGATATIENANFTRSTGGTEWANSYYVIENYGTMTINEGTNVSTAGNWSALVENGWYNEKDNTSKQNAIMTIDGGTFTGGSYNVKSDGYSKLTINGGEFNNPRDCNVLNWNVTTINGGTFNSPTGAAIWQGGDDSSKYGEGTFTGDLDITDGDFTNVAYTIGNVAETTVMGPIDISGGTYKEAIPEEYCTDGFIPTKNEDDTYGVKVGSYVAEVNGKKYETLAEAVKAANEGDTVTLLSDVADIGKVSVKAGVTLDGNGKTISGNSAIYMASTGTTVVKNVKFEDIHNDAGELSAIYATGLYGDADVTITDCTFDNVDWDALQITTKKDSTDTVKVTITGNTFTDSDSAITTQRYVHVEAGWDESINLTITGNKMYEGPTSSISVYYHTAEGSTFDLNGNYVEDWTSVNIALSTDGTSDTMYIANDLVKYFANEELTEELYPVAMVTVDKYNADYYMSLEEALAAAKDGETVILLKDATDNYVIVEEGITLDLNGYELTVRGVVAFDSDIIDSSEENTGVLVVDRDRVSLDIDNNQLPVWNDENGYVFVEMIGYNQLTRVNQNTGANEYVFQPIFEEYAHEFILDDIENSDVSIGATISWEDSDSMRSQDCVYNTEYITEVISSYDSVSGKYAKAYSLGFSSSTNVEGLSFNVVVKSETGVIMKSNVSSWNGLLETK